MNHELVPFGEGHEFDRAFLRSLKNQTIRQLRTLGVVQARTCAPRWQVVAVEREIARRGAAS